MKKTKKIYKEEQEIFEVYCNMCGESIEQDQFGKFYEYLSVDKNWGYLSDLDGESHSFDLCYKCYRNLIKEFKIKILEDEE